MVVPCRVSLHCFAFAPAPGYGLQGFFEEEEVAEEEATQHMEAAARAP